MRNNRLNGLLWLTLKWRNICIFLMLLKSSKNGWEFSILVRITISNRNRTLTNDLPTSFVSVVFYAENTFGTYMGLILTYRIFLCLFIGQRFCYFCETESICNSLDCLDFHGICDCTDLKSPKCIVDEFYDTESSDKDSERNKLILWLRYNRSNSKQCHNENIKLNV